MLDNQQKYPVQIQQSQEAIHEPTPSVPSTSHGIESGTGSDPICSSLFHGLPRPATVYQYSPDHGSPGGGIGRTALYR